MVTAQSAPIAGPIPFLTKNSDRKPWVLADCAKTRMVVSEESDEGSRMASSIIKELTGGRGVDVVYDAVGGPYTETALRSIAWRGRLLVIGFAAGDIPKIPLNLPLLKGCSIMGVFWGDFARREPKAFAASIGQLGAWFRQGKLKPHVSQTFPLAQAVEALKLMAGRKVKGKVVLITGGSKGIGLACACRFCRRRNCPLGRAASSALARTACRADRWPRRSRPGRRPRRRQEPR